MARRTDGRERKLHPLGEFRENQQTSFVLDVGCIGKLVELRPSRASGSTYYAKMAIKQSNTLRVEACAVGRFFCSGNDWSRVVTKPEALITSRQTTAQPPS